MLSNMLIFIILGLSQCLSGVCTRLDTLANVINSQASRDPQAVYPAVGANGDNATIAEDTSLVDKCLRLFE